ncbi:hypothetical protein VTJ04DRAFT_6178 [Mycothermus thermophilus]|uniref:uncharacterized protein n=1 Tax=Humicola insolens TaxID=85995 RepID=UPI003742026D
MEHFRLLPKHQLRNHDISSLPRQPEILLHSRTGSERKKKRIRSAVLPTIQQERCIMHQRPCAILTTVGTLPPAELEYAVLLIDTSTHLPSSDRLARLCPHF